MGTACAAASAVSYGVTIICNRVLAQHGFGPQATLSVRFAISAAVLFVALALRRQSLVPARGERVAAVLLGLVGYAVESYLFYSAVQRGTAAAVALLFYSYPALVTMFELVTGQTRRSAALLGALALSIAGTVVVVAAGERVAITPTGVAFALGSAAMFAAYLLVSGRLVTRTDAMAMAAWVALGASVALTVQGAATARLRSPGADWWLLAVNGVATAFAFTLMFAAVKRVGPSRTSVVMTLEALSAVVLGVVLLGEVVRPLQLVGGVAILGATVVIARSKGQPVATAG